MSAGRRLLRALAASAREAGCAITVTGARERPWASATFVGTTHAIALAGECPAQTAWLDRLDSGVTVPGHVVAELTVERVTGGAELRVLTLEA